MKTSFVKHMVEGCLGITIIPDKETSHKSLYLAHNLLPKDSTYLIEKPHITLYHANFYKMANNFILKILQSLQSLRGQQIQFNSLEIYGDKFLFWNINKSEFIQKAHEQCLKMSKYLNFRKKAKAHKEELTLTSTEGKNIKRYGYPLAMNLYKPHITLGYNSKKIIRLKPIKEEISFHKGTISSINLIEIGEFGSIKKILF